MIYIAIKTPDVAEQRMIDPLWLGDVGEVVKDNRRPHPLEDRIDFADLGGRRVDLNMRSEFVHPLGRW